MISADFVEGTCQLGRSWNLMVCELKLIFNGGFATTVYIQRYQLSANQLLSNSQLTVVGQMKLAILFSLRTHKVGNEGANSTVV